jgi:uncharacterized protein Yka (UPF0111/DUF47 family)
MLGWFRSLMPSQGRFFDQFEAHAAVTVAGAGALSKLFHGDGAISDHVAEIERREHEADDVTRDVLTDVRRVFVTPFDRSAITDLIGVMDDAIDQMHQTANSIDLYGVREFDPQMVSMSEAILEAAQVTAEAMPLLRDLAANASRLHGLTERLVRIDMHASGLRTLLARAKGDAMAFMVGREIYSHLERVCDRFEDVANEIQGLVIDHA